jgi:quinol monooxygenase YgiN
VTPFLACLVRAELDLETDQLEVTFGGGGRLMELDVFARFHAAPGQEERMAQVLREQARAVRLEPGCLYIQPCRSKREPSRFFLFSRWTDEPAFQVHADLDATHRFISTMEQLSDQPVDVHRSWPVDA